MLETGDGRASRFSGYGATIKDGLRPPASSGARLQRIRSVQDLAKQSIKHQLCSLSTACQAGRSGSHSTGGHSPSGRERTPSRTGTRAWAGLHHHSMNAAHPESMPTHQAATLGVPGHLCFREGLQRLAMKTAAGGPGVVVKVAFRGGRIRSCVGGARRKRTACGKAPANNAECLLRSPLDGLADKSVRWNPSRGALRSCVAGGLFQYPQRKVQPFALMS